MTEIPETPTGNAAEAWLKNPDRNKTPEDRYRSIVSRIEAFDQKRRVQGNSDTPIPHRFHSPNGDMEYWFVGELNRGSGVFAITGHEYEVRLKESKGLIGKIRNRFVGDKEFIKKGMHQWWIVDSPEGEQFILYNEFSEDPTRKPTEISGGGWWSTDGGDPSHRIGKPHPKTTNFKGLDVFGITEKMLTELESGRVHIHADGAVNFPLTTKSTT